MQENKISCFRGFLGDEVNFLRLLEILKLKHISSLRIMPETYGIKQIFMPSTYLVRIISLDQ